MTALTAAAILFCLAVPLSIAGMNLSAALMAAFLIYECRNEGRPDPHKLAGPPLYALGAYLAAGLLAAAFAIDHSKSTTLLGKDVHKLFVFSLFMLALPRLSLKRLTPALAISFLALALYGIAQSLTQRQEDSTYWVRAHAFVHPVTFGAQICLGLLGVLSWLVSQTNASRRRWGALFLSTLIAALVLNQTRGAFLGVSAGFAALYLVEKKIRPWARYALAGALAVILLWELLPTGRSLLRALGDLRLLNSQGELNASLARYALWSAAWGMFRDHPWTGVGPGNYASVFSHYFHGGAIDGEILWGSAHNLYLHHLAERGLVGLTALLALLVALTKRAYLRVKERRDAWNLWALASMAAFWVINITEVAFQNEQVATLLLFIWTAAETSYNVPDDRA